MSMSKLRFVCGTAATLAALTLVAGIVGNWFTTKATPPAPAHPSPTAKSATPAQAKRVTTQSGDADDRGFVNSAARCDDTQTALAVGRTQRSLVVICADHNGNYEYRGVRTSDGALLKAPAQTATDGGFVAQNEGVTYAVSPTQLLVTSSGTVINQEPMIEYRQPHPFAAESGAPKPNPQTTSAAAPR
jgi:hypothetical protein